MTEREAHRVVGMLQAAFPARELADSTVQMYAAGLAAFPYQAAVDAVSRLAATRFQPFAPTLAELLAEVIGAPPPDEAYLEVVEQTRRVGAYRRPVFSHPLVDASVRRFGWAALCRTPLDDFARQRFCEVYEALRGRALRTGVLPLSSEPHELAPGFADDPRPAELEPGDE